MSLYEEIGTDACTNQNRNEQGNKIFIFFKIVSLEFRFRDSEEATKDIATALIITTINWSDSWSSIKILEVDKIFNIEAIWLKIKLR